MITHVLDTSALLAHYRQEPGAESVNNILAQGPDLAGISLITVVELRGLLAEVSADGAEAERAFRLYTEVLTTILPFTRETADLAMELRSAAPSRLPMVDALIAASAKQHGAILVHRDPHLAAIPESFLPQMMLLPKR